MPIFLEWLLDFRVNNFRKLLQGSSQFMEMHWQYLFFAEKLIYVCLSLWLFLRGLLLGFGVFLLSVWGGLFCFKKSLNFPLKWYLTSYLNRIGSYTTQTRKAVIEGPSIFLLV